MKKVLVQLFLLFFSSACYANPYKIFTSIDEFIVYEGEPVLIQVDIKPEGNWIIDESGKATIDDSEYLESDTTILVQAEIDGVGLTEFGPLNFTIGKEVFKTKPLKIYKIQKNENPEDFNVIAKRDPNGTNLFHIKIEYKIVEENGGLRVLEIDKKTLPEGVKFKSSSSGLSKGTVLCDFTLNVLTDEKVILSKENFFDIPSWIDFPDIVIPERNKSIKETGD